MVNLVDGDTRNLLVVARATAMRFGCAAGLALLGDGATKPVESRVALAMLRCELFYLDHQYAAAIKIYDREIEPFVDMLLQETALILGDNRYFIASASFDVPGIDRFYHEVDARRLLGVHLRNYSEVVSAYHDASEGKYHNALPTTWKLLLDAYRSQSWRARFFAHADLSKVCLALGLADEAAWHALQADDKDLLREVGKRLIEQRDVNRIKSTIDRLLLASQLASHASLTAEFLWSIADCIPDCDLERVVNWSAPRLASLPIEWADARVFEPTWKLVGRIAHRINTNTVLQLAQQAANHPGMQHKSVVRKHLIDALSRLVHSIAGDKCDQFVQPALTLMTTLKSDSDFEDAVNLACHIASKSESCRQTIFCALFPPGVSIANAILLQMSSLLGWKPQDIEKLNANALGIAKELRKQVEILEPGVEPSKIGGIGQIVQVQGEQRIIVHLSGGQYWLDAMASHVESLNALSIRQLTESILELIGDDRNIVTNRAQLVDSLDKFIPYLDPEMADRAAQLLGDVARGNFKDGVVGQTHNDAVNPLNAFKTNWGDPRNLRGGALFALSKGAKVHKSWSSQLHSGLLQIFLEFNDEVLPRYGVAAARDADEISETEFAALIACSLDGTIKVRRDVLHAMSKVSSLSFDLPSLRLAVRAITRSASSIDFEERAEAANAAISFLKRDIMLDARERLSAIISNLKTDVSYSVRKNASSE